MASEISFGFKLPNCGGILYPPDWASPETLKQLAGKASEAGFDAVWLHDHLLTPDELRHLASPPFYDPLITATRLTTLFPNLRVGIATLVFPLRDPVVLAKQLGTLAGFAPGRIIAGVGAGRYKSEFEQVGSDDYDNRFGLTAEYLQIVRGLLSDGRFSWTGAHRHIRDADMNPGATMDELQFWFAAQAAGGIRRAARMADGWITASVTNEQFDESVEGFRTALTEAGKAWDDRHIALSLTVARDDGTAGDGPDLHRHSFTLRGSAQSVAAAIDRYAASGVTDFLLAFEATSFEDLIAQIEWFEGEVRPAIAA
jgi:alkanesulfonate monooxygenase SsuD/methylene tetrahydromethanopterin reductase-like flavin-dependent oxidoreductase (luciferase family)